MRIIAGEFKGRVLRAPKGEGTRPTTDRVREALMSAIASARGGFEGAVVLDAFAGSGALGIEALSRGASCAHFFERDGAALRALLGNVRALGISPSRARTHRADVLKDAPIHARPPFDLVFFDPPYAYAAADVLGMASTLRAAGALSADAVIAYEHALADAGAVDGAASELGFVVAKRKKYGGIAVAIMECGGASGRDGRAGRGQGASGVSEKEEGDML